MQAALARFTRSLTRFRRVQPKVGAVQAWILRRSGGRIKRSRLLAGGQPVLALTTTGRRSGRPRSTTVAYVHHGSAYASAGLNLGSDRHPAWVLNLRADPRATIEVAGVRITVRAREATGAEADALWEAFGRQLSATARSRELANRDVPIFVWDPVDEARARR